MVTPDDAKQKTDQPQMDADGSSGVVEYWSGGEMGPSSEAATFQTKAEYR
jgi:hypothetical protein